MAGCEDVGVLAKPADACALGGGAVVHWAVVDEDASLYRPARNVGQGFYKRPETLLHDVMVVVAPGVPSDFSARAFSLNLGLAVVVAHRQGDDRPSVLQQLPGPVGLADALGCVPRKSVHQTVVHPLKGGLLVARETVGCGDADDVEAERFAEGLCLDGQGGHGGDGDGVGTIVAEESHAQEGQVLHPVIC